MTSDEVLALDELPASVAVIGGGAIGCEFASMLSDLGCKVTVLEALPSILTGCDEDVVKTVARSFREAGYRREGRRRSSRATPRSLGTGHRGLLQRRREAGRGRRRGLGRPAPPVRGPGGPRDRRGGGRPGLRGHRRVPCAPAPTACGPWATSWPGPRSWPTWASPRASSWSRASWASRWCRSTTTGCRGPSTATPRWPSPASPRRRPPRPAIDVVVKKDPFGGNSRARIIGDTEGLVKVVAEQRPDGTAGRILGVHMVGPWVTEQLGAGLPGRQLGGHRRRGGAVHPAAPLAVRDVRRDGAGADRKGTARWLT